MANLQPYSFVELSHPITIYELTPEAGLSDDESCTNPMKGVLIFADVICESSCANVSPLNCQNKELLFKYLFRSLF